MAKRYVPNDTEGTIFVGGVLIPAGEGREIDEQYLPPEAAADGPAEPLPGDQVPDGQANLRDMLAQPIKTLVPALADCSDETLAELARIEGESETPRKTLLAAIGALQLERANVRTGGADSEAGEH